MILLFLSTLQLINFEFTIEDVFEDLKEFLMYRIALRQTWLFLLFIS